MLLPQWLKILSPLLSPGSDYNGSLCRVDGEAVGHGPLVLTLLHLRTNHKPQTREPLSILRPERHQLRTEGSVDHGSDKPVMNIYCQPKTHGYDKNRNIKLSKGAVCILMGFFGLRTYRRIQHDELQPGAKARKMQG